MTVVPFKERTIEVESRVQAYLNLHKTRADGKPWYSLRQHGKVVAHADRVTLSDARFVVNPAGRDKVRETGRKNVHAYIEGRLEVESFESELLCPVRYNPLRDDSFMLEGERIDTADRVYLTDNRAHVLSKSLT